MTKIKGFDGLRGISVLLVIFSHGMVWERLGVSNEGARRALSADVGVTVFFVLSGFLITLLLIEERRRTGTIGLKHFYIRRTLRIFPLYFFAISLVAVVDRLGLISLSRCTYIYAYAYLVNFAPKDCTFSAYSHFWSLAVEEHFYLVWPFVFLLRPKLVLSLLCGFALIALVVGTSLFGQYAETHETGRWTFPAAVPIVCGCLAAFFAERVGLREAVRDARTERLVLACALTGMAGVAMGAPHLVQLVAITLLVLYVFRNQESLLVRLLELRPLAYVGVISYGLYVWQGVFTGNGPYREFARFPPPLDVGLLLTFIAAPVSYLLLERPILRLKARYGGPPSRGRPAPLREANARR